MMIFLRGKRSGFDKTNSLLDKLTAYTMATGLMTTACATLTIAFSAAYPGTMIYIGIDAVVTILYTNGILAAINLRRPQQESTSLVNTSVNAARIHMDAFQSSTSSTGRVSTHVGFSASRGVLDIKATETHGREPASEFEMKSLA
ncbi:hypothetical protein C8Q80DRAFT_668400 [Daedaleopsis nitida]|nr:hypothetical protein C8Q80DRAFT_668400 [Daedaleopsis nitida]